MQVNVWADLFLVLTGRADDRHANEEQLRRTLESLPADTDLGATFTTAFEQLTLGARLLRLRLSCTSNRALFVTEARLSVLPALSTNTAAINAKLKDRAQSVRLAVAQHAGVLFTEQRLFSPSLEHRCVPVHVRAILALPEKGPRVAGNSQRASCGGLSSRVSERSARGAVEPAAVVH